MKHHVHACRRKLYVQARQTTQLNEALNNSIQTVYATPHLPVAFTYTKTSDYKQTAGMSEQFYVHLIPSKSIFHSDYLCHACQRKLQKKIQHLVMKRPFTT